MQLVNYVVLGFVARLRTERGQDLLEYAMLGGLIAAAIATLLVAGIFSGAIGTMSTQIGNCIDFVKTTECTGGL